MVISQGPKQGLVILGSTGSVGTQALDVVRANPEVYRVVALAAGRNQELLDAQAAEFGVAADQAICCAENPAALGELAAHPEATVVLNAVVGFAGLPATIAALESGKRLALANKESLIAAGPVVASARTRGGGVIVPVDSEHSAIFQALQAGPRERVRRVVLTSSGGPFRTLSRQELTQVTLADALTHPTWSMGPKITVDSSTLMNKGLEVIEAHELFDVAVEQIDVVVHPQSVVHGMVEFTDGATIAQLSMPDMRGPIAYALAYPDRSTESFGPIDWTALGSLTFEAPDLVRFPCLRLAYEAAKMGDGAPTVLNAANEVANATFRAGGIGWGAIAAVIEDVLASYSARKLVTIEDVEAVDVWARSSAGQFVQKRSSE